MPQSPRALSETNDILMLPTIYRASRWSDITMGSSSFCGTAKVKIPSYLKRLRGRRLGSVVRVAVEMLSRSIGMNRLEKMAGDLHMKYFVEDSFMNTNSIQDNFNDHYEFSCSSSPEGPAPSINSSFYGHGVNSGSGPKNWDNRFLLRALLPSCIRVKDEMKSELDCVGIPQFIACDEDDEQHSSYMDPHFSPYSILMNPPLIPAILFQRPPVPTAPSAQKLIDRQKNL